MNREFTDGPIIKKNPFMWFYYGLAILAGGAFLLLLILNTGTAIPYQPDWAPDGCSVRRLTMPSPRLQIIVRNDNNFDSESEVADVLLKANESAGYFLRYGGATEFGGRYNIIDIQYRRGPDGIPFVRYYRQRQGDGAIAMLEMYLGSDMTFQWEITNEELEKIRDGELTLGFLQFEADEDRPNRF